MIQPFKEATRALKRAPVYSLTLLLSIAIGIGACTSIFAVIDAHFFASPPYPDPDRLIEVFAAVSPRQDQPADYLPPERADRWLQAGFQSLEAFATRGYKQFLLGEQDEPVRVTGEIVSGEFFRVLGVPARLGRTLLADDDEVGAEPAVVLSERLWRNRFAGDEDVLGRTVRLTHQPFTVVGVMPQRFDGNERVWVTRSSLPLGQGALYVVGIGRLKRGTPVSTAAAEIRQRAAAEVAADSARWVGQGAAVVSFGATDRKAREPTLWIALAVAGAGFLVVLTNLTTLVMSRASTQGPSIAIRAALGAGRWQLSWVPLAEGLVLGLGGTFLGLLIAVWGKEAVRQVAEYHTAAASPTLDLRVVGFAVGLGILASVVVGFGPSWRIRWLEIRRLLSEGAPAVTVSRTERRVRNGLVAGQVALCVVLAGGAGTLTVAYSKYRERDVGYDAARIVVALPDYEAARMGPATQMELGLAITERLLARPFVAGATIWRGVAQNYPPLPEHNFVFEAQSSVGKREGQLSIFYDVAPGFFDALGIPILRGRGFNEGDGPGAPHVAVVTEAAARAWWPGEDALGKRLKPGRNEPWMTVVGVAADIQHPGSVGRVFLFGRPSGRRHLFRTLTQGDRLPRGWRATDCVICDEVVVAARVRETPEDAVRALNAEFATFAPELALREVKTLMDMQLDAFAQVRLSRVLVSTGTGFTLFLALLGLFGVAADAVSRRHREIGIRMALGARSWHILGTVGLEGGVTSACGLVGGLAAVFLLHEVLEGLFFPYSFMRMGTGLADWRVLLGVGGPLLVVALGTTLLGALRATRVDPTVCIRGE